MNSVKKISIVLALHLVFANALGESKEDLVREIFIDNIVGESEISEISAFFADQRADLLEIYQPSEAIENIPEELLQLERELYLEVSQSSLFIFDRELFVNSIIQKTAEEFSYQELQDLQVLINQPVYQKLESFGSKLGLTMEQRMKDRNKEELDMLRSFQDRSSEISKLKLEYLKTTIASSPNKAKRSGAQ